MFKEDECSEEDSCIHFLNCSSGDEYSKEVFKKETVQNEAPEGTETRRWDLLQEKIRHFLKRSIRTRESVAERNTTICQCSKKDVEPRL